MTDRNCLSYWFPRLAQIEVRYPRTEIVRPGNAITWDAGWLSPQHTLVSELRQAAVRISPAGPWFLRTGHFSGKHQWKYCCDLRDLSQLEYHVSRLAEMSETVDFMGLPTDVWVVRERLPVEPITTLPRYSDMPLVPEVRAFIRGGHIECLHPYWPVGAIAEGLSNSPSLGRTVLDLERERMDQARDLFQRASQFSITQSTAIHMILERVARAFPEDHGWSVDLLETRFGWYVTDMAMAERSFHYPGCEKVPF